DPIPDTRRPTPARRRVFSCPPVRRAAAHVQPAGTTPHQGTSEGPNQQRNGRLCPLNAQIALNWLRRPPNYRVVPAERTPRRVGGPPLTLSVHNGQQAPPPDPM